MSLQIDFAPARPGKSPLRLGIGSTLLALLIGLVWIVTNETEAGLPPHQTLLPSEEEVRTINRAIDDINFPWLALLTAIEGSTDDSLRIIQLDASASDERLTLQGEARDSRAVLELPARLRATSAIADARVLSQSPASLTEVRDYPIRFALEVTLRSAEGERP